MEANERELERLLDEGLASYSTIEPLAGLPERVMARIGPVAKPRRKGVWIGTALAAGLAGVAFGAWWILLAPVTHNQAAPAKVTARKTERVEQTSIRPLAARPLRAERRPAAVLPKKATFPTPSPLTAEERQLIAMVKQNPVGTAEAFESLRKRLNEPMEIAPLLIPPLAEGEGQ